jgi:hypothetical protein
MNASSQPWNRGLFVGVNSGVPSKPLKFAENDAKEMAKALTGCVGFSAGKVLVGEHATKTNIIKQLEELAVGPGVFVIYLAGHGAHSSDNCEQYFFTHPEARNGESISLFGDILRKISYHKGFEATVVAILDICREEPVFEVGSRSRSLAGADIEQDIDAAFQKGINNHDSQNAVFIYAAPVGRSVFEYDHFEGSPLRVSLTGVLARSSPPISVSKWFKDSCAFCDHELRYKGALRIHSSGPSATETILFPKTSTPQAAGPRIARPKAPLERPNSQSLQEDGKSHVANPGWEPISIHGRSLHFRVVDQKEIEIFKEWSREAEAGLREKIFPRSLEVALQKSVKIPNLTLSWPEIQAFVNWTHYQLDASLSLLPYPFSKKPRGWSGIRLPRFYELNQLYDDSHTVKDCLCIEPYWLTTAQYRGRPTSESDLEPSGNDPLDCGEHTKDRLVWEFRGHAKSMLALNSSGLRIGLALIKS